MVKNAEKIANRETIAPEPGKLLNITIHSDLYTPLGKKLERTHFTELPQLLQVLIGTLTLVGNRPMPENMLKIARMKYPYLEERFSIPSGITGPAQLVGRDHLTDVERLEIEITYAKICQVAYSPVLDLELLIMTVMTPFGAYKNISAETMMNTIMMKYLDPDEATIVKKMVRDVLVK